MEIDHRHPAVTRLSNICLHWSSRRDTVRFPTSLRVSPDHSDWRYAMSPPDPDAVFAVLRDAEPDVMDRDELAATVKQVAQLAAWLDSVKVRVTRRQRQLAEQGRAEAPKD